VGNNSHLGGTWSYPLNFAIFSWRIYPIKRIGVSNPFWKPKAPFYWAPYWDYFHIFLNLLGQWGILGHYFHYESGIFSNFIKGGLGD